MRFLVINRPLSELTGSGAIGTAPETMLGDIPTTRKKRRKFKHPGVIEAVMREAQYTKKRMDIARKHNRMAVHTLDLRGQYLDRPSGSQAVSAHDRLRKSNRLIIRLKKINKSEAQYTKKRMDIANYHALKAASDLKNLEKKGHAWTPRSSQWKKPYKAAWKKNSQAARVIGKLNRSKKEIDNGLGGEQGTQAGGVPSA